MRNIGQINDVVIADIGAGHSNVVVDKDSIHVEHKAYGIDKKALRWLARQMGVDDNQRAINGALSVVDKVEFARAGDKIVNVVVPGCVKRTLSEMYCDMLAIQNDTGRCNLIIDHTPPYASHVLIDISRGITRSGLYLSSGHQGARVIMEIANGYMEVIRGPNTNGIDGENLILQTEDLRTLADKRVPKERYLDIVRILDRHFEIGNKEAVANWPAEISPRELLSSISKFRKKKNTGSVTYSEENIVAICNLTRRVMECAR